MKCSYKNSLKRTLLSRWANSHKILAFVTTFLHFWHAFMLTSPTKESIFIPNRTLLSTLPLLWPSLCILYIKTSHCSTFESFTALKLECNTGPIIRSLFRHILWHCSNKICKWESWPWKQQEWEKVLWYFYSTWLCLPFLSLNVVSLINLNRFFCHFNYHIYHSNYSKFLNIINQYEIMWSQFAC